MLRFLGNGSAFNTRRGNNCAYSKHQGDVLLLDCGSDVFSRMQRLDFFVDMSNLYVVITHLHADHIGSLGDLIGYSFYILGKKIHILYPDSGALISLLGMMGIKEDLYHMYSHPEQYPLDFVRLEAIPVEHTDSFQCFGYLLEKDGILCYYSGDAKSIPDRILRLLWAGKLESVYQDTSKLDYPDNPHLSLNRLSDLVPEAYRKRVHCMHLDREFDVQEAKSLGFQIAEIEDLL